MNKPLRTVAIIIVVLLVVLAVVIIVKQVNKPEDNQNNQNNQTNKDQEYENNKGTTDIAGNENVIVNEDGTTQNTSDEVKQNKKVTGLEGIEISGLTVKFLKTETSILGKIKNTTAANIDVGDLKVQIIDSNGNVFREILAYVGKLNANTERDLNISTQADISNMKDIKFSK